MSHTENPPVLIVTDDARDYAEQIRQHAGSSIPCTACETVDRARASYSGQAVLLGKPDMIAELITDMDGVEWVQSTWAGVRPLLDGTRRDYQLTVVKGVFGTAMSEYVIAHLLAHELKLPERSDSQSRRQWHDAQSGSLQGRKAGIMGTGSIGRHVAGMLGHFGVRVSGFSRSGDPARNFERVFPGDQLLPFLRDLDYLVAVLPETSETGGLLSDRAFDVLPDHAVLVNIGRANVIDHAALLAALNQGRLAGAVLDVFEGEPLPAESPLWSAPGLTITAHVAAHSSPADVTPIFLENYRRFLERRPLKYVIDFERGY